MIELIVVIALIGILLFFSVPSFQGSVLQDSSRKAVRWVMYTTSLLRQNAVKNREVYILHVELDRKTMWTSQASMKDEALENARREEYEFPDHMEIVDVEYPEDEKISSGQADIHFYPKGYSDRAIIHIRTKDDEQISLSIEPFLPNMKVYDTHVGFEN